MPCLCWPCPVVSLTSLPCPASCASTYLPACLKDARVLEGELEATVARLLADLAGSRQAHEAAVASRQARLSAVEAELALTQPTLLAREADVRRGGRGAGRGGAKGGIWVGEGWARWRERGRGGGGISCIVLHHVVLHVLSPTHLHTHTPSPMLSLTLPNPGG